VKLQRKLDAWRSAGLLNEEQATAIAKYEDEHATGARWVVWGIAAVGGLAISVGIISVIAANWDDIPDKLKLTIAGALLLGSLYAAWRTTSLASTLPRDLLLLFHSGMVLATVGLVAQVYHLHGHPWRAMALCAVLALPAAAIATHSLLSDVVLAFTTLGLGLFLEDAQWFNHHWDDFSVGFLYAAAAMFFLLAADYLKSRHTPAAAALIRWGFGLSAAVAVVAAYVWADGSYGHPLADRTSWPLLVFCAAALAYGVRAFASAPKARALRIAALALYAALLGGAAIISQRHPPTPIIFLGFALFSATCVALAMSAAASGNKLGTNLATMALAARILVLYGELAKDLMTTGVGLIVTGLVCLGVAFGWWRLRRLLPVATVAPQGGAS
jgi:uncharacterized membrane protein